MKFQTACVLALATLALGAVSNLSAQTLATYKFDGSFDPSNVDPSITAGPFGKFGSEAQVGIGVMEGTKYGYILLRERSTNSNSSRNNQQYGQFTLTKKFGFQARIFSVSFKAASAGQKGYDGNGLALRWSFDGYKSDLGNVSVSNGPLDFKTFSVKFDQPPVFGDSVTFRLYAYSDRQGQSLRFQDLTVAGDIIQNPPDLGPPTVKVFGNSLKKKTRKRRYTLSGSATDENTVRIVQISPNRNGPYEAVQGTDRWSFTTILDRGQTRFFIRAIDFAESVSKPVKVTVRRRAMRTGPPPTPTPIPTPTPFPQR